MNDTVVLECKDLAKTYHDGTRELKIFKELNCQIKKGEQVAIIGASGAGKSTLLHLLGGLDKPNEGQVFVDQQDINRLSERKRARLRNEKLGFIYQLHHLLPEFTVLENVCMPMLLGNALISTIKEKAMNLLEQVGLTDRVTHKIGELSGGERQRTAIVRALINDPCCVLADEPTGNLDSHTAHRVYETMLALNKTVGTSFVIVTHDHTIAQKMDRTLKLENGQLKPFDV